MAVRISSSGTCLPSNVWEFVRPGACVCPLMHWSCIHKLGVLHRKWQWSTSCSDGNLICFTSCPGCYHTQMHAGWNTNIWKNKHVHTQNTTQFISVYRVLSPEFRVNTTSLFSTQLSTRGFVFFAYALLWNNNNKPINKCHPFSDVSTKRHLNHLNTLPWMFPIYCKGSFQLTKK